MKTSRFACVVGLLVIGAAAACGQSPPALTKIDLSTAGLDLTMDTPDTPAAATVKKEGSEVMISAGPRFKVYIKKLDKPFDMAEKKAFWKKSPEMVLETFDNTDNLLVLKIKEGGGQVHVSLWYATTIDGQHYLCTDGARGPQDTLFTKDDVDVMLKSIKSLAAKPKG